MRFFIWLLVTYCCFIESGGDNGMQWITQDEFANRLPATLAPTFTFTAQTSGECFVYCAMKNCSSVGYSSAYKSCQLYSHPTLVKPLAALAADPTGFQHQMYYPAKFCPPGWESDPIAGKCYYMDTVTQLRSNAWQVCEEHLMSEMVMFQTPWQRDYLYQILSSKYSNTTKWWTGYALFDSMLWPRPIDEIPGYRTYRGECNGNDIASFATTNPGECASKCDRKYHDQCVGFLFNANSGTCYLKNKMCDINSNSFPLGTEMWMYVKIAASRPMPRMVGYDMTNGINLANYVDISLSQCINYARQNMLAVHFGYYPNNRQCWLHGNANPVKGTCGSSPCTTFDKNDIADGWCPYGVRYRDVCLVYMRSTGSYNSLQSWCRSQGGKFTRPVDGYRKMNYLYALNARAYVDYTCQNHVNNFTTQFDFLPLSNSVYNRMPWNAATGEPNNSGGIEFCVTSWTTYSDANGNYFGLNDCPCNGENGNGIQGAVCEFPITQSYPKDCRFTTGGREYMGKVGVTASGALCKQWSTTTFNGSWRNFPDWYTSTAYCRSPNFGISTQPWCYRQDNNAVEACNIPMCPESDWAPSQIYDASEQPYAAITQTNTQSDSYYWTVESITAQANALCQIDMNKWCPYYFRGSCYQLYKIPNNHQEAQAICTQNGWHLASLTTKDEQLFIMSITQNLGNQWIAMKGYHIGLYWRNTTSSWAWENNEPFVQTFWQSGQPGSGPTYPGLCGHIWSSVAFSGQGWWGAIACWYKQWFICEIELAG